MKKTETKAEIKAEVLPEVKAGTKARKEKSGEKTDDITRIYLGPSIKGTPLTYGSIFKGELPEYAKEFTQKYPKAQVLFASIHELVEKKKRLGIKGSYENSVARELKKI